MTWTIYGSDADISSQSLMATIPASKEAYCSIEFTNRGTTPATVSFWVVPALGSVGNDNLKESATTIYPAGYSGAVLIRKFIATAGATIYAQASNSSVSCQVSGDETAIT